MSVGCYIPFSASSSLNDPRGSRGLPACKINASSLHRLFSQTFTKTIPSLQRTRQCGVCSFCARTVVARCLLVYGSSAYYTVSEAISTPTVCPTANEPPSLKELLYEFVYPLLLSPLMVRSSRQAACQRASVKARMKQSSRSESRRGGNCKSQPRTILPPSTRGLWPCHTAPHTACRSQIDNVAVRRRRRQHRPCH